MPYGADVIGAVDTGASGVVTTSTPTSGYSVTSISPGQGSSSNPNYSGSGRGSYGYGSNASIQARNDAMIKKAQAQAQLQKKAMQEQAQRNQAEMMRAKTGELPGTTAPAFTGLIGNANISNYNPSNVKTISSVGEDLQKKAFYSGVSIYRGMKGAEDFGYNKKTGILGKGNIQAYMKSVAFNPSGQQIQNLQETRQKEISSTIKNIESEKAEFNKLQGKSDAGSQLSANRLAEDINKKVNYVNALSNYQFTPEEKVAGYVGEAAGTAAASYLLGAASAPVIDSLVGEFATTAAGKAATAFAKANPVKSAAIPAAALIGVPEGIKIGSEIKSGTSAEDIAGNLGVDIAGLAGFGAGYSAASNVITPRFEPIKYKDALTGKDIEIQVPKNYPAEQQMRFLKENPPKINPEDIDTTNIKLQSRTADINGVKYSTVKSEGTANVVVTSYKPKTDILSRIKNIFNKPNEVEFEKVFTTKQVSASPGLTQTAQGENALVVSKMAGDKGIFKSISETQLKDIESGMNIRVASEKTGIIGQEDTTAFGLGRQLARGREYNPADIGVENMFPTKEIKPSTANTLDLAKPTTLEELKTYDIVKAGEESQYSKIVSKIDTIQNKIDMNYRLGNEKFGDINIQTSDEMTLKGISKQTGNKGISKLSSNYEFPNQPSNIYSEFEVPKGRPANFPEDIDFMKPEKTANLPKEMKGSFNIEEKVPTSKAALSKPATKEMSLELEPLSGKKQVSMDTLQKELAPKPFTSENLQELYSKNEFKFDEGLLTDKQIKGIVSGVSEKSMNKMQEGLVGKQKMFTMQNETLATKQIQGMGQIQEQTYEQILTTQKPVPLIPIETIPKIEIPMIDIPMIPPIFPPASNQGGGGYNEYKEKVKPKKKKTKYTASLASAFFETTPMKVTKAQLDKMDESIFSGFEERPLLEIVPGKKGKSKSKKKSL